MLLHFSKLRPVRHQHRKMTNVKATAQGSHREAMRRDWDERARKDAFFYIADWDKQWDPDAFFASGEADVRRLVDPALPHLANAPEAASMLEIGCGVGRMTRSFARRFARVYALDISPEMIARARAFHSDERNVLWLLGDGTGLAPLATGSLDFVFSYLVLQHLPTKELTLGYVREVLRVLKPGGVFLFQFNSRFTHAMNWKGRLIWSVIDRLRRPVLGLRLESLSRGLCRALGLDEFAAGQTWRGASLEVREVLETLWADHGAVINLTGWGESASWCLGKKLPRSREPAREGQPS